LRVTVHSLPIRRRRTLSRFQLFLIVVSVLSLSLAAIMRERVVGERDARDYRERLNLGLEAAQVGTWEWDILRGLVFLSEKSSQIFGLSPIQQELSFNQFLGLVCPTDRATLSQAIQGAIEQRAPYECEFRIKRHDSGTSWVLSKGKALYDRIGKTGAHARRQRGHHRAKEQ
jgi:PAS domain-containing protein